MTERAGSAREELRPFLSYLAVDRGYPIPDNARRHEPAASSLLLSRLGTIKGRSPSSVVTLDRPPRFGPDGGRASSVVYRQRGPGTHSPLSRVSRPALLFANPISAPKGRGFAKKRGVLSELRGHSCAPSSRLDWGSPANLRVAAGHIGDERVWGDDSVSESSPDLELQPEISATETEASVPKPRLLHAPFGNAIVDSDRGGGRENPPPFFVPHKSAGAPCPGRSS
jgi:hypothetical protein